MNFFLVVAILLSFVLRLIFISNHLQDPFYAIQQDGYADYVAVLKGGGVNNNEFSLAETRLFPGYPILIFLAAPIFRSEIIAGLAINFISSALAIFLFWKIVKNTFLTSIFSFFPPVWFFQSTKISTEPVIVLLLLLSVFVYLRKKYLITGLLLGFSFDIRLISICLLFTLLLISFNLRFYKSLILMLLGFFPIFLALFVYNFFIFGHEGLFRQFQVYYTINTVNVGAVQILKDIFRTIDWKQYRILVSGLFYLTINLLALFQLFRYKNSSLIYKISFYWMGFSLLFILTLGPTPLLEEFSRFSVPFVSALVLGVSTLFLNKRINN